jgi:hypothetical protein
VKRSTSVRRVWAVSRRRAAIRRSSPIAATDWSAVSAPTPPARRSPPSSTRCGPRSPDRPERHPRARHPPTAFQAARGLTGRVRSAPGTPDFPGGPGRERLVVAFIIHSPIYPLQETFGWGR